MVDLKMDHIKIHPVDLVGYNDILGRTVGRILYGRLREILEGMNSSGVLIIDFAYLDQVDASTLAISVVKTAAMALKSQDVVKVVVCSNTTETHREQLKEAVAVWAELHDPWREQPRNRLLLLASDRTRTEDWVLLGKEELSLDEISIWYEFSETNCIGIENLCQKLNIKRKKLLLHIDVFIQNNIFFIKREEHRSEICSLLTSVQKTNKEIDKQNE